MNKFLSFAAVAAAVIVATFCAVVSVLFGVRVFDFLHSCNYSEAYAGACFSVIFAGLSVLFLWVARCLASDNTTAPEPRKKRVTIKKKVSENKVQSAPKLCAKNGRITSIFTAVCSFVRYAFNNSYYRDMILSAAFFLFVFVPVVHLLVYLEYSNTLHSKSSIIATCICIIFFYVVALWGVVSSVRMVYKSWKD